MYVGVPSHAISEGGLANGVGSSSGGRGVSVGVAPRVGICVEVDVMAEDEFVAVNVGDSTNGEARNDGVADSCAGAMVAIPSVCVDVLCAAQAVMKNREMIKMILRI